MSNEKHPLTLIAQNEKVLIVIHIKDPSSAERVRGILSDVREIVEDGLANVSLNTITTTIQDIAI